MCPTVSQGILVYINPLVSYKNIGGIFYKFNVYGFWNVVDGNIREKEECDCICTILNSNILFINCGFITDMIEEKTWTWEISRRTNQGGKESRLEF